MNIKKILMLLLFVVAIIGIISSVNAAEVTSYKWGSGEDVTKNALIKKNIPKSQIATDTVKAAKKGTPIIKFDNDSGPKTLIVSGVHGSELSSQVASIKLINYLNKLEKQKLIKGTVYVVPFLAPKSTAANVRFFKGMNLNSVAKKGGTLTNNVIKFAKVNKIDAAGDFHCSRPGGNPGKNIIFGTKENAKSCKMSKAISKSVGHPYRNGQAKSYPGALESNLNLNKIPAVTCEVKTPHGTIAKGSVSASYKQMIAFLKYNKNI